VRYKPPPFSTGQIQSSAKKKRKEEGSVCGRRKATHSSLSG